MNVLFVSPSKLVRYEDSQDHFRNGLLRLMNLDVTGFGRWLALSEQEDGEGLLDRLRRGWERLRPAPATAAPLAGRVGPGPRGMQGRLWHTAIAESPTHGVAVSEAEAHGWLVRWDGECFVFEQEPPVYEEEYFEGDKLSAGGYGDYTAQSEWRLEKSARQVREMRDVTGLTGGRVLDIGSGYGFLRVAQREAGYEDEGLEVSAFAREVARASYGLETHGGTLDDHWRQWGARYDAATMFDLIEHLAEPDELMAQVAAIVKPGGFVGIKTPNIDCPEADVFGLHYHSLKREHLGFFSPQSLSAVASRAGFEPVSVTTVSHLLQGFVGTEQTAAWERELRGADIVAWYRRLPW
jgi:2-polyprenyl-3-methyl-5-hydroxy-6-metoxy-1,4-benzoquinol methylase